LTPSNKSVSAEPVYTQPIGNEEDLEVPDTQDRNAQLPSPVINFSYKSTSHDKSCIISPVNLREVTPERYSSASANDSGFGLETNHATPATESVNIRMQVEDEIGPDRTTTQNAAEYLVDFMEGPIYVPVDNKVSVTEFGTEDILPEEEVENEVETKNDHIIARALHDIEHSELNPGKAIDSGIAEGIKSRRRTKSIKEPSQVRKLFFKYLLNAQFFRNWVSI
jgi:hypothetical protein